MKNEYHVYFMASNNHRALYIGVTNNLVRRVGEHKQHTVDGFTKKYNCKNLVYFESAPTAFESIEREKKLKKWSRAKKNVLVDKINPEWRDLSEDWS